MSTVQGIKRLRERDEKGGLVRPTWKSARLEAAQPTVRNENRFFDLPTELREQIYLELFFVNLGWTIYRRTPISIPMTLDNALCTERNIQRTLLVLAFSSICIDDEIADKTWGPRFRFPAMLPLRNRERVDLQKCVLNSSWFSLNLLKSVFTVCCNLAIVFTWMFEGCEPSDDVLGQLEDLCYGQDIHRYFRTVQRLKRKKRNFFRVTDVMDSTNRSIWIDRMHFSIVDGPDFDMGGTLHQVIRVKYIPDWLITAPFTKAKFDLYFFLRRAADGFIETCDEVVFSRGALFRGIQDAIGQSHGFALRLLLELEVVVKHHCTDQLPIPPVAHFHAAAAHDKPDMMRILIEMDESASLPGRDEVLHAWAVKMMENGERYGTVLIQEMVDVRTDFEKVRRSKDSARYTWALDTWLQGWYTNTWDFDIAEPGQIPPHLAALDIP